VQFLVKLSAAVWYAHRVQPKGLIPIVTYLLAWVTILATLFAFKALDVLPRWVMTLGMGVDTTLIGGLAGCVYCLRGVYVNHSVKQRGMDHAMPSGTSCALSQVAWPVACQ
jgi:hypothetical protein